MSKVKQPYLIQRGTIDEKIWTYKNRNKQVYKDVRLSEVVSLDYMGSAEFEFGALGKSLCAIFSNKDSYTITTLSINGVEYYIYLPFTSEEFSQYFDYLDKIYHDKLHLKEIPNFGKYCYRSVLEGDNPTNFWWDLDNKVMFTTVKCFAENGLTHSLNASWKKMGLLDEIESGTA